MFDRCQFTGAYENEWFEEINVARKIKEYLEREGYKIIKFNENKRSKGHDIVAEKNGKRVIVEVKGYPYDKYVIGKKKGDIKPTRQTTQARHWFSKVIFQVLLAKSENPNAMIYIGLPKFKTYERLIDKLENILKTLKIGCYLVEENGTVIERIKIN